MVLVKELAYNFSEEIYNIEQEKMALSRFTFLHPMVRLIFLEQVYRENKLLNNDPYHHKYYQWN